MKRLVVVTLVVGLALCIPSAEAAKANKCSPEGTWYGYNDQGNIWIVTISRSGPKSYTTVMDYGANPVSSPIALSTDWRGEFVKTGSRTYKWTTMALMKGDATSELPFVLGLCPLTATFTGCDSWEGTGECSFYGLFSPDADPFEEGFVVLTNPPLHAFFKRMPMTFPAE